MAYSEIRLGADQLTWGGGVWQTFFFALRLEQFFFYAKLGTEILNLFFYFSLSINVINYIKTLFSFVRRDELIFHRLARNKLFFREKPLALQPQPPPGQMVGTLGGDDQKKYIFWPDDGGGGMALFLNI